MINSLDMRKPLLAWAIFIVGCSQQQRQGPTSDDLAAVDALNKWWKESNFTPPQEKAGTVKPAHTITSKNGRVYKLPAHVETLKEAEDEAKDARYMARRQALIRGFSVRGKTVTVLTSLSRGTDRVLDPEPPSKSDGETLCQDLGGFVWANPNRHFALEDIEITGAQGEILSTRSGLAGSCTP